MRRLTVIIAISFCLVSCNQHSSSEAKEKTVEAAASTAVSGNLTDGVNAFVVSDSSNYCNYAGEKEDAKLYTFPVQTKAVDITKEILSDIGLPSNFTVLAANVPNAMAYMYSKGEQAGKRYIFYNPKFFLDVQDSTHTDWAKVSILCHEIGHHLAGHTLTTAKRPEMELEADKFSGFILRRMGATEHETIAAMEKLGSVKASATHPDKFSREAAILAGWEEADYKEEEIAARREIHTTTQKIAEPPNKAMPKEEQLPGTNQEKWNTDSILPKAPVPNEVAVVAATVLPIKDFYIINTRAVKTEKEARLETEKLKAKGYKAGYLWIPDYPSLSKNRLFTVYIGPFFSQFNCELAVENYRKDHPDAYGTLISETKKRVQINGIKKVYTKINQ